MNALEQARARFLCLVLALGTLLLFLPLARHGFLLYDDPEYLTENPPVEAGLSSEGLNWAFTTFHASNWHPLTWLSHMLDFQLFGPEAGAHHLVSVLLHAAAAVLLLRVLLRTTQAPWPSFIVAALFAWHPLRLESVAWAAERKDVLSALFWMLTLWAYSHYAAHATGTPGPTRCSGSPADLKSAASAARPGSLYYLLALLFFTLGLMSKPMLVTLPFALLLLDLWPLNRAGARTAGQGMPWVKLVPEKAPFFLLSGASCVVTFLAQRADAVVSLRPYPLSLRLGNTVLSYGRYLLKTVWPVDLAVFYPLPHQLLDWLHVAAAALFLVATSWLAWSSRRTRPHLLVGWLWYLGTLVPVIGLVQVGGQAMADRYTYIPSNWFVPRRCF